MSCNNANIISYYPQIVFHFELGIYDLLETEATLKKEVIKQIRLYGVNKDNG